MPAPQKQKMLNSLQLIAEDKTEGLNIKKMQGVEGYRLRIGQYRAVYTIDLQVLTVEKVAPRGSIY